MVELGGGLEAQDRARATSASRAGPAAPSRRRRSAVPGSCRFGRWEVRAELRQPPPEPHGGRRRRARPGVARRASSSSAPGARATGCARSASAARKSLQDLFTDRKVPRSLRRTLPVVTSGDRIAWIAGVAVSEEFAARPPARDRAAVLQRERRRDPAPAVDCGRLDCQTGGRRRADRRGPGHRARTCSGGSPSWPRRSAPTTRAATLLLVAILKGAVPFLADLMRELDGPLRARLHGRLELRLLDRLLRRGPDPQGPRRADRGPRRADRRGHHRLGPDSPLSAAEPAGSRARPRWRCARC